MKKLHESVASPDLSAEATFTLAVWVTGAPVAADNTPTATGPDAPAAGRKLAITAKRGGAVVHGSGILRIVTNGGGAGTVTVQPWFFDDTQGAWIKWGPVLTITPSTSNISQPASTVSNMCGAKFFVQVLTNAAGVTALGYDYV